MVEKRACHQYGSRGYMKFPERPEAVVEIWTIGEYKCGGKRDEGGSKKTGVSHMLIVIVTGTARFQTRLFL